MRWQGRCREMFLFERAPEVIEELRGGLKLFTIRSECDYLMEVSVFDELSIRMRLEDLTQTQVGFAFDYVRVSGAEEALIARGRQRVACMRATDGGSSPVRVPESLRQALAPYAGSAMRRGNAVLAPAAAGAGV
ncbi:MAG TPA: acyl-CoA thioesterase [Trebonia sp.]|nr:acyl-CoA thioesterase [Trebonia sp.]